MGKKVVIGLVVGALLFAVALFVTGRVIKGIYTSDEFRQSSESTLAAMFGGKTKVAISSVRMIDNYGVEYSTVAVSNPAWDKPLNIRRLSFTPESPISTLLNRKGRILLDLNSSEGSGTGYFDTEGLDADARITSLYFKSNPMPLSFFGRLAGEGTPIDRFAKIFRGTMSIDANMGGGDSAARIPSKGTIDLETGEITLTRRLPRGMTPTFAPSKAKLNIDGRVVRFIEPMQLKSRQMDLELSGFIAPPRTAQGQSPLVVKVNGSPVVHYLAGSMFGCRVNTPNPGDLLNQRKSEKTFRLFFSGRRPICR